MRDEMVDGSGRIRPHWRRLIGAVGGLGKPALEERARRLERAAEEDGAASMLPGGKDGPGWRCDPIPLPLTMAEFAGLEAGLAQRARMLEALLADLYGPQRLLREGLIPPALVYGNPAFLRPWRHPLNPPRRPLLHLYAAELIRCPDGVWRLVSDRTGLCSGLGVVQENRRLLAQAMPEALAAVKPRSLSTFFDLWQDSLQRLSHGSGAPALALLTPGHRSPHWFEHVVLSRELGAALVEPGDLTVRGGALFIKTLAGLQPVDVLVSRQEAEALDPLEFPDADAASGVPGLLDAARHGRLTLVNAPGAALAESPGLLAFSDALCRALLDEAPLLEVLPTRWSPEPPAHPPAEGRCLIRPAVDGAAPGMLAEAAGWRDLPALPGGWALTDWPAPSAAPCFSGQALTPMPILLRLFAVRAGGGWQALPGGLARVLEPSAPLAGRLPGGGLVKDVWVLAEEEAMILGPAPQALPPLPIRRSAGALPSRVADNLFWLGRYVERLDRAARLIRATLARLRRGVLLPRENAEVAALARCLAEAGLIPPEAVPGGAATSMLAEAISRAARPAGPVGQLQGRIADLTGLVRDRLTADMYATFTQQLRAARRAAEEAGPGLDELSRAMVANLRFASGVAGVAAENMVRGGAWLFLELGRRLERAQAVLSEIGRVLDVPPPRIEAGLRLVLELCDSVITYRSRYLSVLQPAPVLDLVLADPANPRGLCFQLAAMGAALAEVAGDPQDPLAAEAASLRAEAEAMIGELLAARDQAEAAAALPPRLAAMAEALARLSDAITRRYFALLPPQRALTLDSEGAEPAEVHPA
ncbi:MAG: circularly permuted type 2 ATP-grasp protein [Rhodovarius sp.]|nr:circularly permuted type 2 ATP-grasp protein [Rhodovarius sp.]